MQRVLCMSFLAMQHGSEGADANAALAVSRAAFAPAADGALDNTAAASVARWAVLRCCRLPQAAQQALVPLLQVPLERELAAAEEALAKALEYGGGASEAEVTAAQRFVSFLNELADFMATDVLSGRAGTATSTATGRQHTSVSTSPSAATVAAAEDITRELQACRMPLSDALVARICAYASSAWPMMWLGSEHTLVLEMYLGAYKVHGRAKLPGPLTMLALQAALAQAEGFSSGARVGADTPDDLEEGAMPEGERSLCA
jgi:hypothetical protein